MNSWEPPSDLTRLLAALADEIVAATDAEVHFAWLGMDTSLALTAREAQTLLERLRERIATMADEPEESDGRPLFAEAGILVEWRQRPH